MIITSSVTTSTGSTDVVWNGNRYFLEADSNVEVNTDDTLKITSPYSTHNIELKKTRDQTTFNQYLGKDLDTTAEMDYNDTHKYISDDADGYAIIVPKDAVEMNAGHYVIRNNTEFIEVIGDDPMYMITFTSSYEEVG